MDELDRVAAGHGQGGRHRADAASRSATSEAWSWPIGDSGVSAWPWKRPSTMNVDSPWRTRTSVASRPSGMSGAAPAVSGAPAVNERPEPDRPQVADGLLRPDRLRDRVRHVVVEGQDHERVLARPGPGEVHRADVDVGLAEHQPDPTDRARPVHVAGDEHVVGRRHVEPVVVEPGDPRLAAGDRPGHDRRPAAGLARQREQGGEGPGVGRLALDDGDPARLGQGPGVDQVDPLGDRGLEQPAQDRGGQRRPVELGELAGDLERQRAHAAA